LTPLAIKNNKSETSKTVSFSSLVEDMKNHYSSQSLDYKLKKKAKTPSSDIDYIFSKPKASHRCQKEQNISDALNDVGIFQINLGVLLHEYTNIIN